MQNALCTYQVPGLIYFVESKLFDINMPQKATEKYKQDYQRRLWCDGWKYGNISQKKSSEDENGHMPSDSTLYW